MALRGNLIGAADDPGILGRAVLLELFEKLFKARVKLANRADAVEAQRQITGRRHGLVYSQRRGKGKRRRQRFTKAQREACKWQEVEGHDHSTQSRWGRGRSKMICGSFSDS